MVDISIDRQATSPEKRRFVCRRHMAEEVRILRYIFKGWIRGITRDCVHATMKYLANRIGGQSPSVQQRNELANVAPPSPAKTKSIQLMPKNRLVTTDEASDPGIHTFSFLYRGRSS